MKNGITVVFVVANEGFQPIEYAVPKKLLEQAGINVLTASNKLAPAIAKDGSSCSVDMLIQNIKTDDIDGVFIVGGPGALNALDNPATYTMLKQVAAAQKKFGAICISTRILAQSGLLNDKQATGWNGDNELPGIFKQYNVHYKTQDVVRDGDILTATGPEAAREYGEQIISMFS
jgi:putative intracellular protease/amidase